MLGGYSMIILIWIARIIALASIGSFLFSIYGGTMTELGRHLNGRPFTAEEIKELEKWDY